LYEICGFHGAECLKIHLTGNITPKDENLNFHVGENFKAFNITRYKPLRSIYKITGLCQDYLCSESDELQESQEGTKLYEQKTNIPAN
jgi:hypothetical protein